MKRTKKTYMDTVASLGCLICGEPAELHHPRAALDIAGVGKKANDWLVLPLCPRHHNSGAYGEGIHASYEAFRRNHGSESELLARVIEQIWRYK